MQNVTESTLSAGVHKKTFTFGQTQPDFIANAGEFFTLWGNSGIASNDQKLYDAIVSELTLTCAPGANEGMAWAAPTFVGRYSHFSFRYFEFCLADFFYKTLKIPHT